MGTKLILKSIERQRNLVKCCLKLIKEHLTGTDRLESSDLRWRMTQNCRKQVLTEGQEGRSLPRARLSHGQAGHYPVAPQE